MLKSYFVSIHDHFNQELFHELVEPLFIVKIREWSHELFKNSNANDSVLFFVCLFGFFCVCAYSLVISVVFGALNFVVHYA